MKEPELTDSHETIDLTGIDLMDLLTVDHAALAGAARRLLDRLESSDVVVAGFQNAI
jgi:FXSXX-COOH protein